MNGEELPSLLGKSMSEILEVLRSQPDRYDSHLPVLAAIGAVMPIRRVAEYGPGFGSTPAFLRREWFPQLTSLVSYEESDDWCRRLAYTLPADSRWDLRGVNVGNLCFEADPPPETDLAFIDSATADGRLALCVRLRGRVPVVVFHDWGVPPAYVEACALWPHVLIYDTTSPATAILLASPPPPELLDALVFRGWRGRVWS